MQFAAFMRDEAAERGLDALATVLPINQKAILEVGFVVVAVFVMCALRVWLKVLVCVVSVLSMVQEWYCDLTTECSSQFIHFCFDLYTGEPRVRGGGSGAG